MKQKLLTLGFIAALSLVASGDMVVRSYQPLRHDRFYTGMDKAFVGNPYDFSGVGFTGTHWATLISDSYFISATHFHAAINASVTFWEANDQSGPSHTYTVAGGQQIGGTDLWVGRLNTAAVHPSIARYSVLDLPTAAEYLGLTLYNYGLTHRVGRNVSDALVPSVTVGPSTGDTMWYDYNNIDTPSVGGDETFVQVGDSGAPSFTVFDGKITALGIHWAITDSFPGTNEGEYSIDTFVPSYITALNAVLNPQGQSVSVVPEPSAALFIFIGATGLALRHRRRTAPSVRR